MPSDQPRTGGEGGTGPIPRDWLLIRALVRVAGRYRWFSIGLAIIVMVIPPQIGVSSWDPGLLTATVVALALVFINILAILGVDGGKRSLIAAFAVSAVLDLLVPSVGVWLGGPPLGAWFILSALPYVTGGIGRARIAAGAIAISAFIAVSVVHLSALGATPTDVWIGASLPAALCAAVLIALVRRGQRTSQRLSALSGVTDRALRGELVLSPPAAPSDELGLLEDSFHGMVRGFADTISSVQREADESAVFADLLSEATTGVLKSSEVVSVTATELAHDMESQESHAEAGRGNSLEAAAEASALQDRAGQMASGAERLLHSARTGRESVQRASETLIAIGDDVRANADTVQVLNAMSERIGTFATTIRRIARQTHVLALNAAIEAANAGGANDGFTAVAEEVRSLAAQAGSSGSEVGALVDELRDRIGAIARAMSAGEDKVRNVGVVADEAQRALDDLVLGVSQINELVTTTADISTKQARRMAEIASQMVEIAAVSTRSSDGAQKVAGSMAGQRALIEDLNAVSHQLTGMAARVLTSVERFSTVDDEDGSH